MDQLLLTREALLPLLLPQVNVKQLSDLTKLVRGSLSNLSRRVLAALITIDVHARDIIGVLVAKRVSSTNDFDWQMQLRYYWEEEDLVVRQVRLCGVWMWVGEIMSVYSPAGACRDVPECTQKILASPGNGSLAQNCGAMQGAVAGTGDLYPCQSWHRLTCLLASCNRSTPGSCMPTSTWGPSRAWWSPP